MSDPPGADRIAARVSLVRAGIQNQRALTSLADGGGLSIAADLARDASASLAVAIEALTPNEATT